MAAPKSYPGDSYIKTLFSAIFPIKYNSSTGVTSLKDANNNLVTGNDVIITNGVGNFVTADNVQLTNSHNNTVNAKNAIISDSNGSRINGADHTVKRGSNYCSVDGDANWVEGYASYTNGFGNVNCGEYGVVEGNTNQLGVKGRPNVYTSSSIKGNNNIVEGSRSHAIGSNIIIRGNDIVVIGTGSTSNPVTFSVPGVYILNQQIA